MPAFLVAHDFAASLIHRAWTRALQNLGEERACLQSIDRRIVGQRNGWRFVDEIRDKWHSKDRWTELKGKRSIDGWMKETTIA